MKSTSCRRKQTRNQRNKLNKKKKNINITKKKNNAKLAPTDKLKHIKAKQLNSNSTFVGNNTKTSLCIKGMDEINDYIHEYLVFHAYDLTIEYFEKERITNSYTQSKIEDNLMNTNIVNNDELRNEILQKIIIMFDANDINGILKLLNRYLSKDTLNNNSNAIKIECHLHIFKFVTKMNRYKKKKNLNKNCIQNLNVIRSELQKYFNDNGQRLALCQDALPYFSLPYIDNAQTHPVFSHFYQPKFAHELRSQLTGCILKSIDNISVPKLHSIFAISKQKQTDIQNNNLTKILRITSEFVNSMQYCLNNNLPPTSAMINDCKQKMSMIANNILRKSKRNEIEIIDSNGNIPSIQYENDIKQLETLQLKKPIMQSENQMKTQLENQIQLNINYNKMHKQLNNSNVSIDEQIKLLLLLQSLRWRITNLIKHNDKRTIVIEYIKNDIFELQCNNENKLITNLLSHSNIQIIETSLRLLNVISSFSVGRTYVSKAKHNKLINILSDLLTNTTDDNSIRMNCLGILQKLSLRKKLQDVMIEKGLIGFIIEMLNEELNTLSNNNNDNISEYSIEYSTALLMNLTLRSKGKKQCQLNEQHIDKILNTLLKLLNSSFVSQIHTYVNGVLYSILSEKYIHEIALKIDLKNKLNNCVYDDPSFKQQIDYIISLISSKTSSLHEYESDDASNEDYSENEDYQEYDINELNEYLTKQNKVDCVYGDQFLFAEYQTNQNTQNHQYKENLSIRNQNIAKKHTENEHINRNVVTPKIRSEKWMHDQEYRSVFEPKSKVPRTPPYKPNNNS